MKFRLKTSVGFTLIELLLVVGIIAVASIVAYITLPRVQSSARANAEGTKISIIQATIKNLFAGTSSYASLGKDGITAANFLTKMRGIPESMIVGPGQNFTNSFGGITYIIDGQPNLGPFPVFYIVYTQVPNAECVKIFTSIGANFAHLHTQSGTIKQYPSIAPVDPVAAADSCDNNDNNIMVLYSK